MMFKVLPKAACSAKLLALILMLALLASTTSAAPYIPGSGWQAFGYTTGHEFNNEAPFTFSVSAEQHAVLKVTDYEWVAERYEVFNGGLWAGLWTSQVWVDDPAYASTPDAGFGGGNWSKGAWNLASGDYSLTFRIQQYSNIRPGGHGAFSVEVVPEPSTAMIAFLGAAVFVVHRCRPNRFLLCQGLN